MTEGATVAGPHRWTQHAVNKPWWPEVARVVVTHYATMQDAMAAEREAIRTERPLYNIVHKVQ